MSKSIYREALDEVSKRVSVKRAEGDKAVSFAVECTNYAIEVGYKNWSLLAKDMKAEDLEKGICWNCNHIDSSLIKVCVECGRKCTSLTGEFKIRNSRVYHG